MPLNLHFFWADHKTSRGFSHLDMSLEIFQTLKSWFNFGKNILLMQYFCCNWCLFLPIIWRLIKSWESCTLIQNILGKTYHYHFWTAKLKYFYDIVIYRNKIELPIISRTKTYLFKDWESLRDLRRLSLRNLSEIPSRKFDCRPQIIEKEK